MKKIFSAAVASVLALSGVLALTGCQSAPSSVNEKASEILSMELPVDVSPQGVLLAAVLLSTSDIEGALAEGLVTPAEVDFAQQAIDDGLIDQWRQRAEQALTGK